MSLVSLFYGCVAVLLLCVLAPARGQNNPPPQPGADVQFPGVTRCLDTTPFNTSCLPCRVRITVDARTGRNCSRVRGSLNGVVCTELEDVIESIATRETVHPPGSCSQVLIQPRAGGQAYTVLAREGRVIQQSVVFTGTAEVWHL